jgi:glycosyltransferase involved in cell wall biosynthesis
LHYASPKCIGAAIASLLLRKQFYFFIANTDFDQRRKSKLKELLKLGLFRAATGLLATGPWQKRYAANYQNNPSLIYEIGNPTANIALNYRTPSINQRDSEPEDPIRLLYVGRLSREKSLDTLIKAMQLCKANGQKTTLTVVGAGAEEPNLRNLAEYLDVKVTFVGFIQQSALGGYYSNADVFVLPSLSEPWGLVVNEAMYFGLPILLSNKIGCAPVLLDAGCNGTTFTAGDANDLAIKICNYFSNPEARVTMGENSKRIVANHSIENWVHRVLKVFSEQK